MGHGHAHVGHAASPAYVDGDQLYAGGGARRGDAVSGSGCCGTVAAGVAAGAGVAGAGGGEGAVGEAEKFPGASWRIFDVEEIVG